MVHSDSGSRLQQLDAARQALRQQTAAREEAERLLADARNTIHDLETKLGHERLARDEVAQRINAERLQIEEALTAAQEELATERAMRARAERERDEAVVATQTAEQRLRQRTAVKAALPPPAPFPSDQPPRASRSASEGRAAGSCSRRFRDRGMVVARVAGEVSVESYRTRGGSRIARPTTATSRAATL